MMDKDEVAIYKGSSVVRRGSTDHKSHFLPLLSFKLFVNCGWEGSGIKLRCNFELYSLSQIPFSLTLQDWWVCVMYDHFFLAACAKILGASICPFWGSNGGPAAHLEMYSSQMGFLKPAAPCSSLRTSFAMWCPARVGERCENWEGMSPSEHCNQWRLHA